MNPLTKQYRQELIHRLFPAGVPTLWCPTLTHFSGPRKINPTRIRSHLKNIAGHANGILVPGSTGEGWQMDDDDVQGLLEVVVHAAQELNVAVLIGVLKTEVNAVLQSLDRLQPWLEHSSVIGITVCPPKGKDLTQSELQSGVEKYLDCGIPTALYQLPQVTENEMSPETVATLADAFPNFFMFKDTSGLDRVAQSGIDLGGVFMVRGSESGGYWPWMKEAGGNYDGFLLSSANVFAPQLAEMQHRMANGRTDESKEISERVERVIASAFKMVASHPAGNPFTNANKVLDHIMAYGDSAQSHEPPMLYDGSRLPIGFMEFAIKWLRESDFYPSVGYEC